MATAAEARADAAAEKDKKKPPRDPAREVIATVVFVVVLVLLLKLFVTEAFVIPTGSMAETLYGYQKLIVCQKCGHEFPVNATGEAEGVAAPGNPNGPKQQSKLVKYCCPNCRFVGDVHDLKPVPEYNSGDRVLVLKPIYHLREPARGDVIVFKYPQHPQENQVATNYIKRAMGFGGETVAIHRGDLYVTRSLAYPEGGPLYPRPEDPHDLWQREYMYANSPHAEELFQLSRAAGFSGKVQGGFEIVRKGEQQLLADMRVVWDNDRQPQQLEGVALPRWQILGPPGRWAADNPGVPRAFTHSGDELDWIRYQHLAWKVDGGRRVPWRWEEGERIPRPVPGPVDNMLGYNAGIEQGAGRAARESGDEASWVGDLILECEVEIAAGSSVVLDLSKGPNHFQATFGNGQVGLTRVGPQAPGAPFNPTPRPCPVNAGTYKLRFANVDSKLWVWVDGKLIDFGDESAYSPVEPSEYLPEDHAKEGYSRDDVEQPAMIGARGPVAAVRHVKLSRDVYYTRTRQNVTGDGTHADIYYIQPGHYMALGDNSASSSDSREWGVVPERLLLGKAVFVFYPVRRVGLIK